MESHVRRRWWQTEGRIVRREECRPNLNCKIYGMHGRNGTSVLGIMVGGISRNALVIFTTPF